MLREHENNVGLPKFVLTQSDAQGSEENSPQIARRYQSKQEIVQELHDQLVRHLGHRQDLDFSIAEFDEPVCITSESEVFLFAPGALGGEEPGDLPGRF